MVWNVRFILVVLAFLGATPLHAVQVNEVLPDTRLEARALAISQDLRCMVCQNQSIDDSGAPLARDLRLLVRERLKAGDSDTQVVDYIVARYGEFVLLKPRMSWHTAILWGAPLTILIIGLFAIGFSVLRRPAGPALPEVAALTEGERLKLNANFPMSQQAAADRQGHDMHPQKLVRLVDCRESSAAGHRASYRLH
jgi:cytochrome c-type biogenesis protein CcmH